MESAAAARIVDTLLAGGDGKRRVSRSERRIPFIRGSGTFEVQFPKRAVGDPRSQWTNSFHSENKTLTRTGQICDYDSVITKAVDPTNSQETLNSLPSMKLKLLAASLLSLIALTSASYADTVFYNGAITTTDLTSHVAGQSTTAPGIQYYDLFSLTVTTTGSYTFELSSRNTAAAGSSNALDTWLALFTTVFNPVTPGAPSTSNDDFSATLTVLPGPFTGDGLTSAATGFVGAQPSSRFAFSLTAGTTYFLYVSSFRATTYVRTGTEGGPTGPYWGGVTGPGTIVFVPEPSTAALLGLVGVGAVGLGVWRKRRVA